MCKQIFLSKIAMLSFTLITSLCIIYVFILPMTSFSHFGENQLILETGSIQTANAVFAGSKAEALFIVRNVSNRTITIYSAKTNCGCSYITNLPMELQAGQTKPVRFVVKTRPEQANQRVKQEATLYTDSDKGPIALAIVVIVGPSSPKLDESLSEGDHHLL